MSDPKHVIRICMGSSCFSRGNGLNAELLQRYIQEGELSAELQFTDSSDCEVVGTLCEGHCKEGPILTIDGVLHRHVSPNTLKDIVIARLGGKN